MPALKGAGNGVALLFANSNIDTREEFDRRLREARKLAAAEGVEIAALPYDHGEWLREVAAGCEHEPEGGGRCARCFRYNLGKAAEFARARGFDSFTTSLTVSPHKASPMVFSAAEEAARAAGSDFAPWDFKRRGGYARSVARAKELGMYRQSYCGCEFSKFRWRVHHRRETASTNLDARDGVPYDVFTADYQTAGRGRLDHKWHSPPGAGLLMSAVLPVGGLSPEAVSTLPLVAGLAVARGLSPLISGPTAGPVPMVKWPNDVLINGRKVAGILCERSGDKVIVGIGVNVKAQVFPEELQKTAISLESLRDFGGTVPRGFAGTVPRVRNAILGELGKWHGIWREKGFGAVYPEVAALDALKGKVLAVRQTDDDAEPLRGVCGGIQSDGSLDVGGARVYAGEAHVERANGE